MEFAARFDAKGIEEQMRRITSPEELREKILGSDRTGKMRFIEGPPTMNGMPHAGHLRGRVIKDLWYRFNTLCGYQVEFNGGWDTQGLPVELQAEQELGVSGGKAEAVQKFGIERIVAECKRVVKKYNESWLEADRLLGVMLNHDRSYWTYDDRFIEREWRIIERARKGGILEEDHTVIAYCPSCQTSLSHAEVSQGYEEVTDPSMYYKVKLADEDAYLVVWTTMPFTLVTDAMVGLHPDEEYAYVSVNGQTLVVGRARLEEFASETGMEGYRVVKTAMGSEFEGKRYAHPLLDVIPGLAECSKAENFHVAVAEGFVDATTGSGLVHLSPANGEDDIRIASRRGVRVFCPIDDEAKFTKDAGKYAGMRVRDADDVIIRDMRERGMLVSARKIRHKYPLCWRSRHRIVWLARRGWFYKLDRLGDKAARAAESVEYFFDQPKNRFLGIIRERHPWCISRERFWGCPLPVWDCLGCGEKTWVASRKEMVEKAAALPDGPDFELHRPWIDRVRIRCGGCGGSNTVREEYVLDTWHNSGAAPFASLSDDEYAAEIPAPFLTEGIDQTRGWAYTLLIENVILSDAPAPPYESFLFQGHVLDEKGGKMSKSKGNVLEGLDMLRRYPADIVRLYFMWKSSPIEPLSFSTDEMMSRPYSILSKLYNMHLYYVENSTYDRFDDTRTASWARREGLLRPPDSWILSKVQGLIRTVTAKNRSCRFHEAARAIDDFIVNSLSNTYIPMIRADLLDEGSGSAERRTVMYAVIRDVLRTLDVLIHPLCPYTSDYLYRTALKGGDSILLEGWPEYDETYVDRELEEAFDAAQQVISASSAARAKGGLKRRWPLDGAIACVPPGRRAGMVPLLDLLKRQLNVERLEVREVRDGAALERQREMGRAGLPVRASVGISQKSVGPKARQDMQGLMEAFSNADPGEILESLHEKSSFEFEVNGRSIALQADDFEVEVGARDGYEMFDRDGYAVFVSSARSREMTARGLVKDIARRLQKLRKERGHNPTDTLEAAYVGGLEGDPLEMVREKAEDLAFLVRVRRVEFGSCPECIDEEIDGRNIKLGIR